MLLVPLLGVVGCVQQAALDGLIDQFELNPGVISANSFDLMTLANNVRVNHGVLHVYLGGDGKPWAGELPSEDPSGKNPIAVALMSLDPTAALYLARPCYYKDYMPSHCDASLWSSGRYSETIVAAMTTAIGTLAGQRNVRELVLIGYSGGGVLALLIAQRLPVVSTVVTVAANLDIDSWTQFHSMLPLKDSLNPVLVVPPQTAFKQIHLLGGADQIVPGVTVLPYIKKHPAASYYSYPGFDHRCCWVQSWPEILQNILHHGFPLNILIKQKTSNDHNKLQSV